MKSPTPKPAEFLAALVSTGYLPHEVPPAITTKYFSRFCKAEFAALKANQNYLVSKTTNYETFTAPRTNSGRRNLALVHPLAQTAISLLITQHRKNIRELVERSGLSLYRFTPDDRGIKAAAGLDFRKRDTLGARIYSENQYVLQADISRFFTLLTLIRFHGLSWEKKK